MKRHHCILSAIIVSQILIVGSALAADSDDGFVSLFDGKNLDGWVQRGGKAKYTVEDGMIVGTTGPLKSPNSFLCTEKNYRDFVFEMDYKIDPAMNSGVQFRSECFDEPKTVKLPDGKEKKIAAHRVHGYQYEIDMDPTKKVDWDKNQKGRWWTAGIYDEARREWLYPGQLGGDKKAVTEQGAKTCKSNEWNHVKIEAVGDSIKTWLNGVQVAEIKDSMTLSGFIGLQVHQIGDEKYEKEPMHVYFKNIRIKEIKGKE